MVLGIAWYRPDQYGLLRALAADAHIMTHTHVEWEAGAMKLMNDLRQQGLDARRVDVDVNEMAAWCQRQGKPFDSAARSIYAAELLRSGGCSN
jgi:hypothetical protein